MRLVLGAEIAQRYRIVIGDPHAVADLQFQGARKTLAYRDAHDDAPYFNWRFAIDNSYQTPFAATHDNVAALELSRELPRHQLASNLRRVFSSIVAGNVKEQGIAAVEAQGPFRIRGEQAIMRALDAMLTSFVAQHRMRLPGRDYRPCYELVH